MDQSRILFPSPFLSSRPADACCHDARVKIQFKHHSVRYTVFCSKCRFAFLRIQIHTAEFIARKLLAVLSNPGLSEEDRAGRFMIDHRCKDQKQNSSEDATDDASKNIYQPFEKQFPGTHGADACSQHRVSSQFSTNCLFAASSIRLASFRCTVTPISVSWSIHLSTRGSFGCRSINTSSTHAWHK